MALTDILVRNAKAAEKARKITDGDGLYLYVTPAGSKLWRMDCRFEKRRLTLSFGQWPETGLAAARALRDTARALMAEGRDPRNALTTEESENVPSEVPTDTVKAIATRWLNANSADWSMIHLQRTMMLLDKDLYPRMGDRPAAEIEPADVLAVVREVEARGVRETAHRLRGIISRVFRFGVAEGVVKRDPAADIKDALIRRPRVKHRAKFTREELPRLTDKLRNEPIEHTTRDALWLTLITAVRTNETRFAHVDEFENLDGTDPLWRIPAERMKMGRDHIVPLPVQAVEIVRRRLDCLPASGLLFGKGTRSGVISENGMLYALYRMGYHSRVTVHGFRGAFSTIANEQGWNRDWIEMQLAHVEGSVRSAYNAAEYLPGRRELLQWWADLVTGVP